MEKFFMYSKEQQDKRSAIEKKIGRKYIPGTIMIDGTPKKFTEVSNSFNSRFKDVILVYQGDPSNVNYTMPKILTGRGN